MNVLAHRHTHVGQVRQLVERRHGAAGVVNHLAARILPREAANGLERSLRSQRFEEMQQRLLTLRSDDEVDTRRLENGVGVLRREISAPHDRHVRERRSNGLAHWNGLTELRSRHHGHRQERWLTSIDRRQPRDDLACGIRDEVAVDERPRFLAFENRRQRQDGQWKRLLPRRRRQRVEQQNH